MEILRVLGPVAVVAAVAGCAGPPAPAVPAPAAPVLLVQGPEPAPTPVDAAPLDVTTVPGCGSGCEVRFDIALPDGGRLAGVQSPATGAPDALLVRRTAEGEVRTAEPVPGASVTEGVCDAQRCVAVLEVDAQAVEAVVVDVDDLTVTGSAGGGTGARPVDLDGDDRVDVALPLVTGGRGEGGPVSWWTWRQTPDGALEMTGCRPPADDPEAPEELQTGPCPI